MGFEGAFIDFVIKNTFEILKNMDQNPVYAEY